MASICKIVLASMLLTAMAPSSIWAQDCALTPWRCSPPAGATPVPPPIVQGVATGADFWGPMVFSNGGVELDGSRVIYAIGTIEPNTPDQFDAILRNLQVQAGAIVVFHSPGGYVAQGLELGRAIRSRSLRTKIAQPSGIELGNAPWYKPGLCASSCSLAFLGGVERTIADGSQYGVHDVSSPQAGKLAPDELLDLGQKQAAVIGAYIHEMGVSSKLLTVLAAANSAAGETNYLSPGLMQELRVITTFKTTWTLGSDGNGFSLVGSNPESSILPGNREQVVFQCMASPRRVILGAYFMPEESHKVHGLLYSNGTPPELFVMQVIGLSLSVLDGQQKTTEIEIVPAEVYQPARVSDPHHVSAFVVVTPRITDLLRQADVLTFDFKLGGAGSAFQFRFDSAGGVTVDLAGGRTQVMSFIQNCH